MARAVEEASRGQMWRGFRFRCWPSEGWGGSCCTVACLGLHPGGAAEGGWSKATLPGSPVPRISERDFSEHRLSPLRRLNRHAHHVRSLPSHKPAVGRSSLVRRPPVPPPPCHRLLWPPLSRTTTLHPHHRDAIAPDADLVVGKSHGAYPPARSTATVTVSGASTLSSRPSTPPLRAWARP